MRTLSEIIDDMQDESKTPTHEECYWALQAYRYLLNSDHYKLRTELMSEKRPSKTARTMKAQNSLDMYRSALNMSPKEWCRRES